MGSATVAFNAIVVEALNQHNYKDWRSRVQTYLLAEDLWDVVKLAKPRPQSKIKSKAWRTKNAKALHAIKISCGTEIFSFIRETSTAKAAWEILEKEFKSYVEQMFEKTEKERSLHTANNAEQTREVMKELLSSDEELEIKSSEGEALRIQGDDLHETALHEAVELGQVSRVEELVSPMGEKELEIKNFAGFTALAQTVRLEKSEGQLVQIARCMVQKNKKILGISNSLNNSIPVVDAFSCGKWEMGRYLYSVTPLETLLPDNGTHGAQLISKCIRFGKGLDIALHLLQCCPRLAVLDNGSGSPPMLELARMRYAFLSGKKLTFLQKWIYNRIHKQPVAFNAHEISINISKSEDDQGNQRDPIYSVMSLYRRFVKGRLVKGINHMYEMKSTHIRVHDFLHCIGEWTTNLNMMTLAEMNVLTSSIFKAVERGHVEFVIHLCKENSDLIYVCDEKDRSIFQYAIECRQEGIYNLIYGLEKEKRNRMRYHITKFNNSMLHCAANLSPLTRIQGGASLQMQRELQWFKEVERIVPFEMHESINSSDGLTARELFTKNHKKLMKEAEISIKGIATSCTTVGALIVTIMFAVAFTVPGGTNEGTGLPMFMHKKLFKIFIVSDTMSLVSSATSVITFLGILTSRYAEDDFLKSLPKKMMVGLSTLFISIATMMIAFFCALNIMLDGEAWIIIPSIMFASVPVIFFVRLLFPLLVEICISTYGSGIFDRNVKPWYQD